MNDISRLEAVISGFSGKRIAVLGDVMLDVYLWGKVTRISPEAPVPMSSGARAVSAARRM